jgi:hypothetical protein
MRPEIGSWEIDGARSTSLSWKRFDSKRTRMTRGLKLLRRVILDNSVSIDEAKKEAADRARKDI